MAALRISTRRLYRIFSSKHRISSSVCTQQIVTYPKSKMPNFIMQRNIHISKIMSSSQEKVSTCFNVQDKDEFKERVMDSSTPTVVDFHADWCGPCKHLGPKLESAVDKHDGKIILAKVDIDDLSDIAMDFGVKVVPTVIGIKDGKRVAKFEGNVPDTQIEAFLNKLLMK